MDPNITQEILDDLIPSLEALETRSTAVLEFLKHEGIATDEKLAPYLEQAASASNVRWLGVRVRIERLLSAAEKDSAEQRTAKQEKKPDTAQTKTEEAKSGSEAGDNSNSAGPENPNENVNKDKETEAMHTDTEPKTNAADNPPGGSDNNGNRAETDKGKSKTAIKGEEQKVA